MEDKLGGLQGRWKGDTLGGLGRKGLFSLPPQLSAPPLGSPAGGGEPRRAGGAPGLPPSTWPGLSLEGMGHWFPLWLGLCCASSASGNSHFLFNPAFNQIIIRAMHVYLRGNTRQQSIKKKVKIAVQGSVTGR